MRKKYIVIFHMIKLEIMHTHIYAIISSAMITDWSCVAKYQNALGVIGTLFGSTLALPCSIAFWNSAGTWTRAPGKQFGVLDR